MPESDIITTMSAPSPEAVPAAGDIRISWSGAEGLPIETANQFLLQVDAVGDVPDLLILTIGQLSPPPVLGTREERIRAVEARGNEVQVRPLGKYSITPKRLDELVDVLHKMQELFRSGKANIAAEDS